MQGLELRKVLGLRHLHQVGIGELAAQHGIRLHELTPQRGSLEEAFMRFTGNAVEYQASALTGAGVAE